MMKTTNPRTSLARHFTRRHQPHHDEIATPPIQRRHVWPSIAFLLAAYLIVIAALPAFAGQTNTARVFRLIVPQTAKPDEFTLKCGEAKITGGTGILGFLRDQRQKLNDTDLIVVQWPWLSLPKMSGKERFFNGLVWICRTSGAQLSYYQAPTGSIDITNVVVVHCKAPFARPLDEAKADYYVETRFVGSGTNGLHSALGEIERMHPRGAAFARSRYDQSLPLPPDPNPFNEATLVRIEASWAAEGIRLIRLQDHLFDVFPGMDIWSNNVTTNATTGGPEWKK